MEPKGKADVEAGVEVSPKKKAVKAPVEKLVLEKAKLTGRVPRPPGKKGFKVVSWNITTLRSLLDKTPEKLVEVKPLPLPQHTPGQDIACVRLDGVRILARESDCVC